MLRGMFWHTWRHPLLWLEEKALAVLVEEQLCAFIQTTKMAGIKLK